jgi:squalene synthase HpnC
MAHDRLPDSVAIAPPTLPQARAYCRRLARAHYENFTVASLLLPRRLRQHLYHVYAYCRWADDLADETGDAAASQRLLDWWGEQLHDCYQGRASHPVFIALGETIRECAIPMEPWLELLVAFRQDQSVRCYESYDALLSYCRHSANPVGRLVLYVAGCFDEERAKLSDAICTGLQLANFWQDLGRDVARGRVYLPADVCRAHQYDASMLARREYNRSFCRVIREMVDRAEAQISAGAPLVGMVPPELRVDIALFMAGGLEVLKRIRHIDYNVWEMRPVIKRGTRLWLVARCWWRHGMSGATYLTNC